MEKIKHAAWKRNDGVVAIAKQHADCIRKSPPDTCMKGSENQGFVTDTDRYVEREEAAEIAFKAGQIEKQPRILFSEHMWSKHERFNGKHTYDQERGYIEEEE